MILDLINILNGTVESETFDKSREYLSNARKYSPEQAMSLLLKKPTVFLAPVTFIMFRADTGLNISIKDFARIIMKQARKKNNQKLFEAAKATYEIGKKADF
ncbi:hypothetical protein AN964_18325 [Heyndrickxia shackletonii]|uniref:Uncharacterized protein n=1 Tax=Heyndrickxia shackletonii TaxID=157838 RepID=A0A0Q3TMR0_9BACI|nr:hypothetical protein [Heyndrickxia shackletonii]KQL55272.1 hypothetical protein AN964_18325 [Heyndrickxia shackletonii]NEY98803.1 hypothetical protein [Heyndrickxia shackletonii]